MGSEKSGNMGGLALTLICGLMLFVLTAAAHVEAMTQPAAKTMRLTTYADGLSCPAGCDAHVVMNRSDNGTANAFRIDAKRGDPVPCQKGASCRVCFGPAGDSCMTVMYRGSGPPAGTFDFTPAFYDENCERHDIPSALRQKCATLKRAFKDSGFNSSVNCLGEPRRIECRSVIASAEAARQADAPLLAQCKAQGQARFNASRRGDDRRAQNCYYSKAKAGGPNSRGLTWQKLMPASCKPGNYVGRDATDCCSSSLYAAAALARECAGFFVPPFSSGLGSAPRHSARL